MKEMPRRRNLRTYDLHESLEGEINEEVSLEHLNDLDNFASKLGVSPERREEYLEDIISRQEFSEEEFSAWKQQYGSIDEAIDQNWELVDEKKGERKDLLLREEIMRDIGEYEGGETFSYTDYGDFVIQETDSSDRWIAADQNAVMRVER